MRMFQAALATQTSTNRKPVEDKRSVGTAQSPSLLVTEQKVFWGCLSSCPQPGTKYLRGLGSEEPNSVFLTFATMNSQGSRREVHVFDSESQGLADPQTRVRQ